MKLAFSTLGCPGYSWQEITSMAKDLGFSGIELRGTGDGIFSAFDNPFSDQNIAKTKEKLEKFRIEIPCISTGCALCETDKKDETIKEVKFYIDLAAKLGSQFVRVLGEHTAEPSGKLDDSAVVDILKQLAPYAENAGVILLLETNGAYTDTKRLANVIWAVESDSVGVLWDLHHPYRYAGESPQQTVQNLGTYIKYVQIKDSVMKDGKVEYRMMGEGDLPISDFIAALRSINYDHYITLEWLKTYMPELESSGIVFPQFVNYMREYIGQSDMRGALQTNMRSTGKYVWEKEKILNLTFPQVLDRMCEEFPDQYAFRYTT